MQLFRKKLVFDIKIRNTFTMRKTYLFTLIITFVLFTSAAIAQNSDRETRNLKGFTSIGFGIPGDLQVKIGPSFSVVLEGDKNDIEEVVTQVSGDKLQIKTDRWSFHFKQKVNVYITMPEIEGLSVSGSGKATIADDIKEADALELSVSGSGKISTAGLVADQLECNISGSGNIYTGSGNVDRGEISISGSGSYSGESLEIDHLSVGISGSGNCTCRAGDSIEARVSGSGNVYYKGDPNVDARVSGSGHVRKAN